jgi:hypothetical protein
MGGSMSVNEIPQDLSRRSSSAWAKNALANFKISLARRNSLTSLDPSQQRLWHAANLGCDRFDCRPQRGVFPSVLLHHAHSALTDLR